VLNFPALDVAFGLIFLYFILALVCSGINEAIASFFRWRAQDLERGIWELLKDPKHGTEAIEKLKHHPLIAPMMNPKNKKRPENVAGAAGKSARRLQTNRKTDFPSYISSRAFVTALLGFEQQAASVAGGVDMTQTLRKVDQSIKAIPSERVQEALTALLHSAQGDAVAFRLTAEQWYDDQMERVSGWYRRRVQRVLWVLAFVIAFTLNAHSLNIAKRLWVEPSVRAALVTQAQNATNSTPGTTDPAAELNSLPVPLGWHLATARDDPQGFPFYRRWGMLWALLTSLIGISLTAVAITFGAPFWFDTLSKVARLRNSGAPPPASGAVRHGEGEETRRGPTAQGAALLEAAVQGAATQPSSPDATTQTAPPGQGDVTPGADQAPPDGSTQPPG
jgi:hypothetical protein